LDAALCPEVFWTTIPAGGGGKVRGAQLKVCGYKAGTPDVLIVHRGRARWIELKAGKGRLSESQKGLIPHLTAAGCDTEICRSIEEVQSAVLKWDLPLRGRIT
jgi:hypothetical protein